MQRLETAGLRRIRWGLCFQCDQAVVEQWSLAHDGWEIFPAAAAIEDVPGLPEGVQRTWDEARRSLAASAPMAAAHMFRKTLMVVAVDKGLAGKDEKNWSPTFAACVKYLQDNGFVPPAWQTQLEHVRAIGNEAAHEVRPVEARLVEMQGLFVRDLLATVYESAQRAQEFSRMTGEIEARDGTP
ncbi:DUF4145 domain-containing protein [Brachybacterium sp.]|uniref:DUF4145 domain-containing protein n=1 Tax=Brachybacterium sp. TaxID=1891286 RepID=UPI002ED5D996